MSSNQADEKDYERLYKLAVKAAKWKFGVGWQHIGATFQQALIGQEILYVLSTQGSGTPAETIRAMASGLAAQLTEEFN